MVGDMEKLLSVGQKIDVCFMGKNYSATVLEVDISNFERKYLISFSDIKNDTKWINNSLVRQFFQKN